ncbi:hypothetical protein [Geodermatophilus sp. SYSU D01036]
MSSAGQAGDRGAGQAGAEHLDELGQARRRAVGPPGRPDLDRRRVAQQPVLPPRAFGVLCGAHPVWAVPAGAVLLGQALERHEWAGIGVVVLADAAAALLQTPRPAGADRGEVHSPATAA